MAAHVSGEIFSYQQLKKKAVREITRLESAQLTMDEDLVDYALNAAFTIYHLLEWREKASDSTNNTSAQHLLKNAACESLNILHDIVTFTKHATVSKPQHFAPSEVQINDKEVGYLRLQNGGKLLLESGGALVLEDSRLIVQFGDEEALKVLKDALSQFY